MGFPMPAAGPVRAETDGSGVAMTRIRRDNEGNPVR